jgi:hypothetical protein
MEMQQRCCVLRRSAADARAAPSIAVGSPQEVAVPPTVDAAARRRIFQNARRDAESATRSSHGTPVAMGPATSAPVAARKKNGEIANEHVVESLGIGSRGRLWHSLEQPYGGR